jgi:putative FmdB family regulatory protein
LFVPNYEYQCTKCDNVFELWQNVGEAAPPCPQCAATEVKKVFHPPRVHFKGSGFYLTDLRAEKEKAGSGKTGGTNKSATDSPAETSKPAASDTTSPAPQADNTTPSASK